ncbi:hypothetical protein SNEBB_005790 [Seison nebaliae]|nr:hypothetical protein SNEBB_005790 [Seison nebaliae]
MAGNDPQIRKTPNYIVVHCKSVMSGDTLTVVTNKQQGKEEKQISLSHVNAPRMGKYNAEQKKMIDGEPYGFEAREFIRRMSVGKPLKYLLNYSLKSGKEFVILYPMDSVEKSIQEMMIENGLVNLKQDIRNDDEFGQKLKLLDETMKDKDIGLYSPNLKLPLPTQTISEVENLSKFIAEHKNEKIECLVEQVRDGGSYRLLLLPMMLKLPFSLAGVRCNSNLIDGKFADVVKDFIEMRLLQRDLRVKLLSTATNNSQALGCLYTPSGFNLAETLLEEGMAHCCDWSMGLVDAQQYRKKEKIAKMERKRIWKDYVPKDSLMLDDAEKEFTGKVMEILTGGLIVRTPSDEDKSFFFSSTRPPRASDFKTLPVQRPLYDIPGLFELREFLRKKLIGNKVQISVDYISPATENYAEKTYATVKFGGKNVAEAIILNGLARVVRHRQDDDNRSSEFDVLIQAETVAEKNEKGIFSSKEKKPKHISEITAKDVKKAELFFPSLKSEKTCNGVVEAVISADRFRIFIDNQSCLFSFKLSGVDAPKGSRPNMGNRDQMLPAEPFSTEARQLIYDLIMNKTVQLQVEAYDKRGTFIGTITVKTAKDQFVNISLELLKNGLAKLNQTARRVADYNLYLATETEAKEKRLNMWENYTEETNLENEEDFEHVGDGIKDLEEKMKTGLDMSTAKTWGTMSSSENSVQQNLARITIVELNGDYKISLQKKNKESELLEFQNRLQKYMTEKHGDVKGAVTQFRRKTIYAAKYSMDSNWYRAVVDSMDGSDKISVQFIDYGNKETVKKDELRQLPNEFSSVPSYSHQFDLFGVKWPTDVISRQQAFSFIQQILIHSTPKENSSTPFRMIQPDNRKTSTPITSTTIFIDVISPKWIDSLKESSSTSFPTISDWTIKSESDQPKKKGKRPKVRDIGEELFSKVEVAAESNDDYIPWNFNDTNDQSIDLAKIIIQQGYATVNRLTKRSKTYYQLMPTYIKAEEYAKNNRLNLWQYGDMTEDITPEFGYDNKGKVRN